MTTASHGKIRKIELTQSVGETNGLSLASLVLLGARLQEPQQPRYPINSSKGVGVGSPCRRMSRFEARRHRNPSADVEV